MEPEDADRITRLLAPRLHMLAALARTEHVTRAAESLGMPQPTLSRAIARLQEDTGLTLVERTGRGVRLTRTGRLLLPHVERALADLARGVGEITDAGQGRVGLTFLPTLGVEVVPALLRDFRRAHPGVRFTLVQEPWADSLHRVAEGGADLALTSPLPADPRLASTVLHTQALRLVVPEHHRLAAADREIALAEVAAEEFVLLKPGRGVRHLTDLITDRAALTPEVAFEADDIATARGLVGAGLGVSVLPARPRGPLPGTVELALADPDAVRPIGVVHAAGGSGGGYTPPAVATFLDHVRRHGPRLIPDLTG
ncbi:LysR family transcriptional regulator [Nocardiopsis changdeensis]|uniref:LysR family transcriptional regulator n=1 Tax=Nocardiopsis changdeensis TaxID=2831969 RepID=A0ABX8BDL4_9ACTN|nr:MULTISPECIES: LysR family transcriptional regulator [Nocardiopsis]QUX20127.1 LysR family transcriptional regulator [Nocardiopsis changdeensis]QYX36055.1 LysR family transcriptional regulator [Nocardiopsis sp. MT53]